MASLPLATAAMTETRHRAHADPFEALFVREFGRVATVAHRIVGDWDEAQDVAQEAFLQFQRRYRGDEAFASSWLFRSSTHLALNRLRSAARRSRREAADQRSAPTQSDDPAMAAETNESRLQVRRVLARLPARSASVLALRYSGLSYGEIAETLNCGVGSVGTVLRRAEAAFKKEMQREPFE